MKTLGQIAFEARWPDNMLSWDQIGEYNRQDWDRAADAVEEEILRRRGLASAEPVIAYEAQRRLERETYK